MNKHAQRLLESLRGFRGKAVAANRRSEENQPGSLSHIRSMVTAARTRSGLSENDALELAVTETHRARGQ